MANIDKTTDNFTFFQLKKNLLILSFFYNPQLFLFLLKRLWTFVEHCIVFLWNSKNHPLFDSLFFFFFFFFFFHFKSCRPPPTILECVNAALVISVKADYRHYYRSKTDKYIYKPPSPADNRPLFAVWTLVYHHWSLRPTAAIKPHGYICKFNNDDDDDDDDDDCSPALHTRARVLLLSAVCVCVCVWHLPRSRLFAW